MTDAELIAATLEQERALVFTEFDEDIAVEIGGKIYAEAKQRKAPLVIDIRSSARRYHFAALPD